MQERIYVIAGKQESVCNVNCQRLLDKLIEPQDRATGLFKADQDISAVLVFDELRTLPFLSEKRVVLIKNADKFISKNRDLLEKYFDNPSATGILVFTVSSWNSRTKLAKKLPKVGKLITLKEPKRWQLPAKLCEYTAEAHNKKLTTDAANVLIELSGENLAMLYNEIDKLAVFTDKKQSIDAKDVESLVGHNRLFNSFNVIDSIISRNPSEAIGRLRRMFAEDKSAEYTFVGALAFHFRRMFNAKVLLERSIQPREVANRVRIWSNKEAFFGNLRKTTLKQIGQYLMKLAATDYAIKTGQQKAQVAAEQLVLKLTCR